MQKIKEIKHDISKLRKNCFEIFGVTSTVFDGAMYGKKGKFTKAEVEKVIKAWLKKEVVI